MLSFKDFQKLNENFGGAYTLGLSQPHHVSGVVGGTGVNHSEVEAEEALEALEEAKKKKKMLGDEDGEIVKPTAVKDKIDPKKDIKDIKDSDVDDSEDVDLDAEDSDEVDVDDSEDVEDDSDDSEGDDLDAEAGGDKKPTFMQKKKSKKKMKKDCKSNSKKNVKKEENEFILSLQRQLGYEPLNYQFDDGLDAETKKLLVDAEVEVVQEDALIQPENEKSEEDAVEKADSTFPSYDQWLAENFS